MTKNKPKMNNTFDVSEMPYHPIFCMFFIHKNYEILYFNSTTTTCISPYLKNVFLPTQKTSKLFLFTAAIAYGIIFGMTSALVSSLDMLFLNH